MQVARLTSIQACSTNMTVSLRPGHSAHSDSKPPRCAQPRGSQLNTLHQENTAHVAYLLLNTRSSSSPLDFQLCCQKLVVATSRPAQWKTMDVNFDWVDPESQSALLWKGGCRSWSFQHRSPTLREPPSQGLEAARRCLGSKPLVLHV
eukprot:2200242-Amphidinium_carterae.2